jgi:hypothetical protein
MKALALRALAILVDSPTGETACDLSIVYNIQPHVVRELLADELVAARIHHIYRDGDDSAGAKRAPILSVERFVITNKGRRALKDPR